MQAVVTEQLQALGLTLNLAKTRVLDARQARLHLPRVHGARRAEPTDRGTFPLIQPRPRRCQRLRDAVKALTAAGHLARPTADVITAVNRVVRGWAGYFHFQHCPAPSAPSASSSVNGSASTCGASIGSGPASYQAFPDTLLYGRLGLYRLPTRAPARLRRLPCGEGDRRAGCGQTARPVR